MLILASASPRRKELLQLIEDEFEIFVSDVCEEGLSGSVQEQVVTLAKKKAEDIFLLHPNDIVIGADTLVFACGEVMGKPKDREDARRMMKMLSGKEHEVYTGVCVISAKKTKAEAFCTKVVFEQIDKAELDDYLDTADIMDKAGAYAIQEQAAKFVKGIEGCYFNVMGLPVSALYRMLKEFR